MLIFQLVEILPAAVVGMLLGALWYSPLLFGPAWMRCLGKTSESLGSATWPMVGSVFACLLMAAGVSLLSGLMDISSLSSAIFLGLILGVCLIFSSMLSDNLFCGWGLKLLLIQAGYRLLKVELMSVIVYLI